MKNFAPTVVRVGVSLVFLWFGTSQVSNPAIWVAWLPEWTAGLPIGAEALVVANGVFEIIFGAALLLGFYVRFVSLVLALHMFGIVFTVGYTAIGVRDFGIALATLSVFLYGPDRLTLDRLIASRKSPGPSLER